MNRRTFFTKAAVAVAGAVGALALVPMVAKAAEAPSPEPLRRVEVYNKGVWTPAEWASLKRGHIFRLREPGTGALVEAGTPSEISLAVEDATPVAVLHGSWCVKAEPFTVLTQESAAALQALGFATPLFRNQIQLGCISHADLRTHTAKQQRVVSGTVGVDAVVEEFPVTFDYVTVRVGVHPPFIPANPLRTQGVPSLFPVIPGTV